MYSSIKYFNLPSTVIGKGSMGEVSRLHAPYLHVAVKETYCLKPPPELTVCAHNENALAKHLSDGGRPESLFPRFYASALKVALDGAFSLNIAMEYIPGESIGQRVARGSLTLKSCLWIAREVAKGLEVLHETLIIDKADEIADFREGVIIYDPSSTTELEEEGQAVSISNGHLHRDLKPQNVLLHASEDTVYVKIIDLGVSQELEIPNTENITGSPNWIAPETVEKGKMADERADFYVLTLLIYYMLTGQEIFYELKKDSIKEIPSPSLAHRHLSYYQYTDQVLEEVLSQTTSALPKELKKFFLEMLKHNPSDRSLKKEGKFKTYAKAFIAKIEKLARDLNVSLPERLSTQELNQATISTGSNPQLADDSQTSIEPADSKMIPKE